MSEPIKTQFFSTPQNTPMPNGLSGDVYAKDDKGNMLATYKGNPNDPTYMLYCNDNRTLYSTTASQINAGTEKQLGKTGELPNMQDKSTGQIMADAVHLIRHSLGTRIRLTAAHAPDYQPSQLCARAREKSGLLDR